jgi:hypothetical protein
MRPILPDRRHPPANEFSPGEVTGPALTARAQIVPVASSTAPSPAGDRVFLELTLASG